MSFINFSPMIPMKPRMTRRINPLQFSILPATPKDVERVCLIRSTSLIEKRLEENGRDITTRIKNGAANSHDLMEGVLRDPANRAFILRIPTFHSILPIHAHDGFQDAGYIELYNSCNTPLQLRVGFINTVKCPFPAGSALLSFAIHMAMDGPYTTVGTDAAYAESAAWFAKRGLFKPINPTRTQASPMVLAQENFHNALNHIAETTGIGHGPSP